MCRKVVTLCLICSAWATAVGAQNMDMMSLSEEIEPKVVELRGLPFLQDVEKTFQSTEELRQVLLQEIERTYPEDTLPSLEKRLLKFGFVAVPIDLQKMMIRLFSQQIAGYYDPRGKKMVLITGFGEQGTAMPIEYVSRLFVERMGYSLEKILLSHELTHVVQDQHFDLLSLPFEALDPEDTTSAVRALIEGDATLVMLDYMLEQQGTDVTQVPEIADSMHAWTDSPFVRGFGIFQTIPKYIIDNLLFSYTYGFDFVLRLKQQGGWELVNQAYRDFPVSTEQILHPEKYLEERDVPTTIQLPELPEGFSGWQELERNTLGEFNISLLIDGYLLGQQARLASAGWDGDRFVLHENLETQQLLLAWYTTWDTLEDAGEFFRIYTAMTKKRYKNHLIVNEISHNCWLWSKDDGNVYIEQRGTDILFLDGVPDDLLNEAIQLFWSSQKIEY